ncbi:MAG: SCP2 sterol-binding domain-containing protein [Acidobacteriota bacterium]|nr:MAG: SCP2 sterol-binding domain-containing protein [Acidobacteriota bacterium]
MADEKTELTVEDFTKGIRERVASASGLDANFKFVYDEGGIIHIDGKSNPYAVTNDDLPADVTLRMSIATMNRLHRKETNPTVAFMTGSIKLEGNMLLAMKLDKILQ